VPDVRPLQQQQQQQQPSAMTALPHRARHLEEEPRESTHLPGLPVQVDKRAVCHGTMQGCSGCQRVSVVDLHQLLSGPWHLLQAD